LDLKPFGRAGIVTLSDDTPDDLHTHVPRIIDSMLPPPAVPRLRFALLAVVAFAFASLCGIATYGYLDQQLTSSTASRAG